MTTAQIVAPSTTQLDKSGYTNVKAVVIEGAGNFKTCTDLTVNNVPTKIHVQKSKVFVEQLGTELHIRLYGSDLRKDDRRVPLTIEAQYTVQIRHEG